MSGNKRIIFTASFKARCIAFQCR